ncbi:hypothetical protein K431DRAFT_282452 [Polychaeton citri CBS 116435]|uniref:Uncharacterized protein n=1 Tax=Polychaeton citri CBS 116435 TaxID=1314669 RepID=A0A9P4UQ62_9PEZI|nr:hypothetical protein K431DRAFT_282452 [Polychaeton citri CBS 116435]
MPTLLFTRTTLNSSGSAAAADDRKSILLEPGKIVVSRTTFTAVITLCALLTLISLLGIAGLTYREYARNRQNQIAKTWALKGGLHSQASTSNPKRITLMRKAVDDEFSSKYGGCLTHPVVENPYLLAAEPVELMQEERLCEAPAIPAKACRGYREDGKESEGATAKAKRKTQQRMSLWFDAAKGLWVQNR